MTEEIKTEKLPIENLKEVLLGSGFKEVEGELVNVALMERSLQGGTQ
jgi:hypothetical protein